MKISTKIFVTFSGILLLFSIATLVNFQQSQAVKENQKWVANSQLVIRNTGRLQRNIIDMESDLRGFLLTRDKFFVDSFDSLSLDNQKIYNELKALIKHTPFQLKNLDTIMYLHLKWKQNIALPLMSGTSSQSSAPHGFVQLNRNLAEKVIRTRIINEFKEFNNHEYEKRDVRKARLNESVAKTHQISLLLTFLSIVVGLAVAAYLVKIISNRIFKMVSLADGIANGNFDIKINDTANDELSDLSYSLNRMARTLKESILELETKNKELDQFAYVVSHDLKAPLRGIENICTWIQEDLGGELSPKMLEYLGLLSGRAKRMENLIQGILDLSKVGRGKKFVEKVNVKQLIGDIFDMLSPGSRFEVVIPDDLPEFVTEKISLQQVFSNLISNSIKYHEGEKGRIEILWEELDDTYMFFVKDDGPGISPKYHEKIFVVFQTLKERDAFESTGVGLSIVKKILNEKKCTIQVFSEEGKGSTFAFTWPKKID